MSGKDQLLEAVEKAASEIGRLAPVVEDTGKKLADMQSENKSLKEKIDDLTRKFEDRRVGLHGGDNLIQAIPENRRFIIRQAEIACQQYKAGKTPSSAVRACLFPDDPAKKAIASEWLALHCMKLLKPGDYYSRAEYHAKLTKALEEGVEKVALQEDVAAEGGNFVPTIVEGEVLRLVADNGLLRPLVRKVTMTTKTHAYPVRAAAFSAAIIAEEGTLSDSVPATPFSQANLTAKKLCAFATVSGELMQDNVVMLGDYLGTEFGEQIARTEDTQGLEGDGTGVNFTGVVAAAGVNSVTSGANGDFLSYQKLVAAIFAPAENSVLDQMTLFMHHQVASAIYRSRSGAASPTDQGGVPLMAPAGGISVQPVRNIIGFPFNAHSGILTNRAVGTGTNRTNLYAGAPRTIIFGDLLGFSIELNPYSKFASFQTDIRGVKRTGILVAVPAAWTKYTAIDGAGTMVA
jgi:HK97 family phage major capsid protein